MASPRCIELLLSAGGFGALTPDNQAARLAQFIADWYGPGSLDTIDIIRLTVTDFGGHYFWQVLPR